MKAKTRNQKSGFSLLEVLFGVMLAGVCAAILAATMPVATSSRIKADLNNKATSLAQKEIESIRGMGYPNVAATQLAAARLLDSASPTSKGNNVFSFTNVDQSAVDSPARLLPDGKGYVTIEQIDVDIRRVSIEVVYTDRTTTRSVWLSTLIANL